MTSVIAVQPIQLNDQPKDDCGEILEKPSSKVFENRASISSVDSSISLSYDATPFTPRDSISNSSGTEDEHHSASCGTNSSKVKSVPDTSGSDIEGPFEPPDEELTKRIVDQVEYYFSDENIVKDAFLLKHVRRNKEGYVSLKLIASFKRVKHIARDWRVVRVALEKSAKLEINEAGTKLRRKDPLPLYDQTTPSRTVVALNIPPNQATIECVAEMFRACGEIALIRILRPGNPIPADVRPFFNKHPEMQETVSALVEFVRTESAHNALNREAESSGGSSESAVQVLELNAPPSSKKKVPMKRLPTSTRTAESDLQSGSESEEHHKLSLQSRRYSNPKQLPDPWNQRRWSRDSGTDSSGSSYSRSRSNSGVYFIPEQRRLSSGWDSSSDSYGSCRSRSNSGASMPEVFQMRRYSLPRTESACCCGGGSGGRSYSMVRTSHDGYNGRPLSRCGSGETCDIPCRRESIPDFYALHRGGSGSFERRSSLSKPNDGQWSRSSSMSSTTDSGRRLSDTDSRFGFMRRGSFSNKVPGLPGSSESVVRLPRGPDGGRGFQRELIEYALPE